MRFKRRVGLGPIELRCERDFFFIRYEAYRKTQKHRRIIRDGNGGVAGADCRQQDTEQDKNDPFQSVLLHSLKNTQDGEILRSS